MMIHLELWKYLEWIVEEFYGDAEEYYMNLYGLLHENVLQQKFEGDKSSFNIFMQSQEVAQMIAKRIVVIVITQP